jgi:hypothetical protein
MATYYKYAERAAGSQVNWAEIGKNLTDTLSEENKLREQKKAAIDEASRQYGITLENSPQGEDKSFNQWGLDFAGDAQEARLLQDRLLKQGKLKLRDYTMMRQNLTDGTKIAFDLVNEYNAEKKVREERAKSMDPATASQYLEQWMAAQAEAFANYKDSKLYINPTTFSVSVGRNFVTKDGVTTMSDNPNDYTTVNELRNRIKTKFDKFDSSGYLKKRVDLLGTEIRATIKTAATKSQTGFTESKEDVTLKDSFEAAQNGIINEAFANPLNISSVLTNNLGMDKDGNVYDFTFDETEAGANAKDKKNYIYMKKNEDGSYEPQFTTDQRDAAVKDMKNQMNSMLDYKETTQGYNNPTVPPPSPALLEYYDNKANEEASLYQWNKLRSGTLEEKAAAAKYFAGIDERIAEVRFTKNGGGVEFVYNDNAVVPYFFYDQRGRAGGELSGESWMNVGNEMLGKKVTAGQAKKYGIGQKTDFKDANGKYLEQDIKVVGGYQDSGGAAPATGTPAPTAGKSATVKLLAGDAIFGL